VPVTRANQSRFYGKGKPIPNDDESECNSDGTPKEVLEKATIVKKMDLKFPIKFGY